MLHYTVSSLCLCLHCAVVGCRPRVWGWQRASFDVVTGPVGPRDCLPVVDNSLTKLRGPGMLPSTGCTFVTVRLDKQYDTATPTCRQVDPGVVWYGSCVIRLTHVPLTTSGNCVIRLTLSPNWWASLGGGGL